MLPPPGWRADNVEDVWLLLHVLLETLWRYRFLFRDLSGIMARDRRAGQRLATVFERAVSASRGICLGLVERGLMTATGAEIDALGENIAVVSLYWLSFESARHPRTDPAAAGMSRGVYQVLMLVAPFLQAESRFHLEKLRTNTLREETNLDERPSDRAAGWFIFSQPRRRAAFSGAANSGDSAVRCRFVSMRTY